MIRLSLLALVLLASGCGTDASGEADLLPPPDSLDVVGGDLTLDAEPVEGADETTREATLVSAIQQDSECFLIVEANGQQELPMATPEACAMAAALEGQTVTLTESRTRVQAADCAEGDDCPEGGTASLVVGVVAAE